MFLVCNFLADQVRFWAFLFLVCIFLADQEHLGRGKCGGDGIPLRRRRGRGRGAQKAPGPRGAACLRYPWGGRIKDLQLRSRRLLGCFALWALL